MNDIFAKNLVPLRGKIPVPFEEYIPLYMIMQIDPLCSTRPNGAVRPYQTALMLAELRTLIGSHTYCKERNGNR